MIVSISTNDCKAEGIFGVLMVGSTEFACLEHAYPQPDGGYKPKLQPGTYVCVRGQHRLDSGPIETFEITGVPGHSGILFHYGNYNRDSNGCVLVGKEREGDMITLSRTAFQNFMDLLKGVDSFNLIVT